MAKMFIAGAGALEYYLETKGDYIGNCRSLDVVARVSHVRKGSRGLYGID